MSAHRCAPAVLGCAFLLVGILPPPDPERAYAERVLREHGVSDDGPSLLRFFAQRTLSAADRARLEGWVRDLADDEFAARQRASAELVRVGPPALPGLKAALKDPDAERALRAERCIQAIESRNQPHLMEAAVRRLVSHRPAGTQATLLNYLAVCVDDSTVWTVREGLVTLTRADGRPDPALLAALEDKAPACRAAAAYALGRAAPTEVPRLRPLLRDADPQVRFEAAVALAAQGDRQAVPVLLALLEDSPTPVNWQVHDLLVGLAGDKAPSLVLPDDPEGRQAVRKAWEAWWRAHGDKVDLAVLQVEGLRQQGVNILLEGSSDGMQSKVWSCRADGRERWAWADCGRPIDVQVLPAGRLLLAEVLGNRVTERDRAGKVVWSYNAGTIPLSCQRLANGNTFLATGSELLEIRPDGSKASVLPNPEKAEICHARRLPNGNTLVMAQNGRIVELDKAGARLRTLDLGFRNASASSFEPLPDGHLLVCLFMANQVFEVDAEGQRSHKLEVGWPASAVRLPNGHTLVASCSSCRAVEYDAAGRVVWQLKTQGQLLCARRY